MEYVGFGLEAGEPGIDGRVVALLLTAADIVADCRAHGGLRAVSSRSLAPRGAKMVVRHLRDGGYRNIAFLSLNLPRELGGSPVAHRELGIAKRWES